MKTVLSEPKTPVSVKNSSIQILRAMAIIAVVVIHSYPIGIVGVFLRPFVNFAVPMFIFLSGYLTKFEIGDYKTFAIKRIKRVLIPYCIWSIIYAVPTGFDGFLFKFLTGRCCGIYYYIFVYVQLVILTPLIVKLAKSRFRVLGWLITPVCTVVFRYVFTVLKIDVLSANFNYLFVAWFIYYYFGLMLGNGKITIKPRYTIYVVLYAVAIALSVGEGLVWYHFGNYDMATTQLRLTSLATSLIALVFSYWFIRSDKLNAKNVISRVLIAIGNASFGVYLSHILVMEALSFVPGWGYVFFPLNSIVILAVSVICVLIGNKILSKFAWIMGL